MSVGRKRDKTPRLYYIKCAKLFVMDKHGVTTPVNVFPDFVRELWNRNVVHFLNPSDAKIAKIIFFQGTPLTGFTWTTTSGVVSTTDWNSDDTKGHTLRNRRCRPEALTLQDKGNEV